MTARRLLTVASLLNSVHEVAWFGQGLCAVILPGQEPGHPGALSCLMLPASPWVRAGVSPDLPCPLPWAHGERQGGREGLRLRYRLKPGLGACRAWVRGWRARGKFRKHPSLPAFLRRTDGPSLPGERATALCLLCCCNWPADHPNRLKIALVQRCCCATELAVPPLKLLPSLCPGSHCDVIGLLAPHCCKALILGGTGPLPVTAIKGGSRPRGHR